MKGITKKEFDYLYYVKIDYDDVGDAYIISYSIFDRDNLCLHNSRIVLDYKKLEDFHNKFGVLSEPWQNYFYDHAYDSIARMFEVNDWFPLEKYQKK